VGGPQRWRGNVVGGLTVGAIRDRLGHRRLGELLAAEPPVLFIRVVLPVLEAQIRRGFALTHTSMLTPSYSAVGTAATVATDQRIEVLM
jgi:hypothetical protein